MGNIAESLEVARVSERPQPVDLDVFSDRRVLLLDRSRGRADDLARQLRLHRALVMVVEGTGEWLATARAADPDLVIVDAADALGWAADAISVVRRDRRLRWASLLLVHLDALWPDGAEEPDLSRIATELRLITQSEAAMASTAPRGSSGLELRLEATGPARMLRALARTTRQLRVVVRGAREIIELDLAADLVVSARATGENGLRLVGAPSLAALLALDSGRVRVELQKTAVVPNMMTPLDEALAAADHEPTWDIRSSRPEAPEEDATARVDIRQLLSRLGTEQAHVIVEPEIERQPEIEIEIDVSEDDLAGEQVAAAQVPEPTEILVRRAPGDGRSGAWVALAGAIAVAAILAGSYWNGLLDGVLP